MTMAVAVLGAAVALAACGSSGSSGGPTELTFFIFNEPSGILPKIADSCSKASNGEYTIGFEYLPSEADQQREQLVRRLGAEDDSIDIIGMDVIWTGEFANAGWIDEWTGADEKAVTKGVFPSVTETARFEDKLWAAPIWSNTQLLWYRSDRVKTPPKTWDQMYQQAKQLGKDNLIEVQANRYEGLMVWFNSMVESAGTSIVEPNDAQQVALEPGATERALGLMVELANSPFADPAMSTSTEDTARLAFEGGSASFMLNYPFVYPSAKENAPDVFKNLGVAQYPRVDADKPAAPAARRDQPRRLLLLQAPAGVLRRDQVHAPTAEPDQDRDRRRPAAGDPLAVQGQGDRQGLPGLRARGPDRDRERRAAPGHPRLPGPLTGDPARHPPAQRPLRRP